ncbi:MAG: hypothetical protein KatS3mg082_1735 [Nitrospiraceae bacterium]|nr:MAG: hypothetical protein KatS3mg082_1735 [Nitrospiraceae bacterium]
MFSARSANPLLHHEVREVGCSHTWPGQQLVHALGDFLAEMELSLRAADAGRVFAREQHENRVANLRQPGGNLRSGIRPVQLELDRDFEISDLRRIGEIDDKRFEIVNDSGRACVIGGRAVGRGAVLASPRRLGSGWLVVSGMAVAPT